MRFNEFNEPALTEEQQIVLDYCQGNITKEDAVKQLSEAPAKLTTPDGFASGGGITGSKAGKSFFGGIKNFFKRNILGPKLGGTGTASQRGVAAAPAKQSNTANRAAMSPRGQTTAITAGPAAATAALPAAGGGGEPDGSQQGPELGAVGGAKPAAPKPAAPQTFGQAFKAARKAAGGAGGVFTFGGKKYNTSIKGEKVGKNLKPVGTATAPAAKPGTPKGMPGAMAGGTKPVGGGLPGEITNANAPFKQPGTKPAGGGLPGEITNANAPFKQPGTTKVSGTIKKGVASSPAVAAKAAQLDKDIAAAEKQMRSAGGGRRTGPGMRKGGLSGSTQSADI